jgi:hypothetical protein
MISTEPSPPRWSENVGLGKPTGAGASEQVQEHLSTATTMYRDMGMRFWPEHAEAEMRSLV